MEEQKPRIQMPPSFNSSLARQPYSKNEYDPASLEEDEKVVPMHTQETISEDERRARSTAAKRKRQGASEAKTRAAGSSKKPIKPIWQSQVTPPSYYVDELKRLQAHAERINQILADRSHKEAIYETIATEITHANPANSSAHVTERQPAPKVSTPPAKWQVAQQSPQGQPIQNQWQSPTPIESQDTETLKSQEHSIHQRLAELGLYLTEAGSLVSASEVSTVSQPSHPMQAQPSFVPPVSPSSNHRRESLSRDPWDEALSPTAITEHSSALFGGIAANRDVPGDRPSHSSPLPALLRGYLYKLRNELAHFNGRSLELPRQPIDRVSDAAVWIAVSAVVRVASRYVVTIFPVLSPIFLVLMLAPALVAVYLACCVPKTGWIPYYRLFLIMVGLLLGGKL